MQSISATLSALVFTGLKAALLAGLVCTPLLTINAVKAGTSPGIIESTLQLSSGAGFVLMIGLQRAR